MSLPSTSGAVSDSQHQQLHPILSPDSHRPTKIQKVANVTPIITNNPNLFSTNQQSYQQQIHGAHDGQDSTSGHQYAPDQTDSFQQPSHQESPPGESPDSEPFCYYQEDDVQESINTCKNSLIEKILSDKSIPTPSLHNSMAGIWSKPAGLKITEIEGKLYQISMDKEQDLTRILKGNPWIIRNCWLVLHSWDRKINPSELDFSKIPLWVQMWGLPLHCRSICMGNQIGSQIGQVLDVGLYDYPDSARIVKAKILFDINSPYKG